MIWGQAEESDLANLSEFGETLPAGPRAVAGPFVIWADVS